MGLPKLTLPFGDEFMLTRVLRLLQGVVHPIVVVAAQHQEVPPIPEDVVLIRDQRPDRGPLEGLAAGLATLEGRAAAAYVTSCDVPLLQQAFVARMIELLGNHDICVPKEDRFHHPLAAVYRVRVLPVIRQLLANDQLRPRFLFQQCDTREVACEDLRLVDSELATLENLNHPDDYVRAMNRIGLTIPEDVRSRLQQAQQQQ